MVSPRSLNRPGMRSPERTKVAVVVPRVVAVLRHRVFTEELDVLPVLVDLLQELRLRGRVVSQEFMRRYVPCYWPLPLRGGERTSESVFRRVGNVWGERYARPSSGCPLRRRDELTAYPPMSIGKVRSGFHSTAQCSSFPFLTMGPSPVCRFGAKKKDDRSSQSRISRRRGQNDEKREGTVDTHASRRDRSGYP